MLKNANKCEIHTSGTYITFHVCNIKKCVIVLLHMMSCDKWHTDRKWMKKVWTCRSDFCNILAIWFTRKNFFSLTFSSLVKYCDASSIPWHWCKSFIRVFSILLSQYLNKLLLFVALSWLIFWLCYPPFHGRIIGYLFWQVCQRTHVFLPLFTTFLWYKILTINITVVKYKTRI